MEIEGKPLAVKLPVQSEGWTDTHTHTHTHAHTHTDTHTHTHTHTYTHSPVLVNY
jgi:hypothetical protein